MEYKLEVITLAVRDVERALEFYTAQCGFHLDVDYRPNDAFRVIQLTPPGSACSVQLGVGITENEPGTSRAVCLAVSDIEAATRELTQQGVTVEHIRHKSSVENWQGDTTAGVDPQRRDYASFATFVDPDGNTWTLQEIGFQSAGPDAQR